MKRSIVVVMIGSAALGLATWATAEAPSRQAGDTSEKVEPAAPPPPAERSQPGAAVPRAAPAATGNAAAATGDLKSQLPEARYNRIAKPIEAKVAEADRALALINKENEKPAEKRNAAAIISLKERQASFYLGAALAARLGTAQVAKPELKAAVLDQFEKPNKQKAIDLWNELAVAAAEKKDFAKAEAYCKRILAIDPENQPAKDALAAIKVARAEAAKAGNP